MRKRIFQNGLTVQAIVGTHAVFLAFDLDPGVRDDCMGFAIHRTDHDANPVEQYWLLSFKTFASVVPNPVPSQRYSTFDHPIQSFYWGDYTAKPGHHYTYRIVPRFGVPKNLTSKPGVEISIDLQTADPDQATHGVYFNRGVAASQAYAQKFGKRPDDLPADKRADAMTWLSRGLLEAILAFIGRADSDQWALRAAVYEFTQEDVLAAFKTAHESGADVQIVFHAVDDDTGRPNETAIANAALPAAILIPRSHTTTIAHNKFIVLCKKTAAGRLEPVEVWTGSTNLSEGGIFGHSNVGHAVRDPAIAAKYLAYWDALHDDPDTAVLKVWVNENSLFDPVELVSAGAHTLFSPRRGIKVLNWYADQLATAPTISNISLPFGMVKELEAPFEASTVEGLRYILLESHDDHQDQWAHEPRVLVAVGKTGSPDALSGWAKETLTGFNHRVLYLHTKVLLIDPVSANPTVVSGSANFSTASTSSNDENMLIVTGDTELADVYLTEFARIFYHFYARYWAAQLTAADHDPTTHSFLDKTPNWATPYFTAGTSKSLVRELFTSQVEANT